MKVDGGHPRTTKIENELLTEHNVMCTYCTKLKCTRTSERDFPASFITLTRESDESFSMLHSKYELRNCKLCIYEKFKNLLEAKLMVKSISVLINYILENFNLLIVLCVRSIHFQ